MTDSPYLISGGKGLNLKNMFTKLFFCLLLLGMIHATFPVYASPGYKKIRYDRNAADYPSIQDAIDSLPPTGGVVLIPASTYIISAPIKVPANVTLIGEGFGTYLKLADGANCNVIENMHFEAWIDENIHIANMRIDGNKAHQTAPVNGIYLNTARGARIENIWAHSFPKWTGGWGGSAGFFLLQSPNAIIRYNTVENNSYTGIFLYFSHNSKVSHNHVYRSHRGIYLAITNNTEVTKNTLINNDVGIRIYGSASDNRIFNNHIEGSFDRGIGITHPQCENNLILTNWLIDNKIHISDSGTNTKLRANKLRLK